MVKKWAWAVVPALIMPTLAACGSTHSSASGKKITVTLLTPNYYPSTKKHPRVGVPVGQVDIRNIIADYEKLHPNVVIDDITPPPWSALNSWVTSHAADHSLPDILEGGFGYFTPAEDPSEFVNLSGYLSKPNPDNKSASSWAGTFIPGLLDRVNANVSGEYGVPVDWYVIHTLWYNKTLLQQLHLQPPKTVAELLQDLKVIKAKDPSVTPIEGQFGYFTEPYDGTGNPWWDNVLYPLFKKITPNAGYSASTAGLAYAYKQGWLSYNNPRVKWLSDTLFKDFLPYTVSLQALKAAQQNGVNSLPNDPFDQFVRGKIAFMPGAGYLTEQFYGPDAVHPPFQVAVERMPLLTKQTTPYANSANQNSGASTGVYYTVTQEAQQQHVTKWAVSFLQYLTSVKNDQELVNNGYRFIPGVNGAHPLKSHSLSYTLAMSGPVKWNKYPTVAPLNPLAEPSINAENRNDWAYFELGQQSYSSVAAKVDANNLSWANQIIAQDHLADPYK